MKIRLSRGSEVHFPPKKRAMKGSRGRLDFRAPSLLSPPYRYDIQARRLKDPLRE